MINLLVVDDHQELLEYVGEALVREGFEVARAASFEEAVAALRAVRFDLVVLDLGLPDGSGIDLCRTLRNDCPETCVLVLTANTAVASRVAALDAGADDYLMKPFALAELRARVRAHLRRRKKIQPTPPSYSVGGVHLDFDKKVARVDDAPAPVTAREWTILRELARGFPGYVARTDLLARSWPDGGENRAASLDVLLSRLRQKLGAETIVSRRGLGVALREPSRGEQT